jgi:hypothetical protein
MRNDESEEDPVGRRITGELLRGVPQPTQSFRRRAWLQFQRAIDPLAPPKPFRISQRH